MDTGYTTLPAAAVALRRHADHEVRHQPHRDRHGVAELRGHGHPRRGQPRPGVSSVALDLSLWDPNTVQNIADVPEPDDLADGLDLRRLRPASGFSRGQTDPNNFGYTLAATVEGADYTTQVVNGTQVRLNITPTSSYTIWFTAASRINSPGLNSVQQASNQLTSVKSTGYATTLTNYKNWWHAFWAKSFVQYSGGRGDADYMENVYYLVTYMIAAGGYGNYPVHFINGVFRATQDRPKWSNGYWYWNQRDVYNSFLASNHADLMAHVQQPLQPQLRRAEVVHADPVRHRTRSGCRRRWAGTATRAAPSTATTSRTSTRPAPRPRTTCTCSTGTPTTPTYLRDVAYPFMRESVRFYQNRLSRDGDRQVLHGQLELPRDLLGRAQRDHRPGRRAAAVPADHPGQPPSSASTRACAPAGRTSLEQPGAVPDRQNGAYLPHDPPISQTRNNENVALELVWPYDLTGIGYPDYQTALNTWNVRPHPYGNVWSNDARAGRPARPGRPGVQRHEDDAAEVPELPQRHDQQHQRRLRVPRHPPVRDERVADAELQRQDPGVPGGADRLLASSASSPCWPRTASWSAPSARRGEIKYVGLTSLYGKQARVVNPWGTQQVRVRRTSDNAIIADRHRAAEVDLRRPRRTPCTSWSGPPSR